MHDPSSRACASYWLEDYRARNDGKSTTIPAMSDAEYDRHVENLADRIQETVEQYLGEIAQPRTPKGK